MGGGKAVEGVVSFALGLALGWSVVDIAAGLHLMAQQWGQQGGAGQPGAAPTQPGDAATLPAAAAAAARTAAAARRSLTLTENDVFYFRLASSHIFD